MDNDLYLTPSLPVLLSGNHCSPLYRFLENLYANTGPYVYKRFQKKKSFILKRKSPYYSSDLIIDGYKNTGFLLYDLPHVALKKGFAPSGQTPR